MEKHDLTYRIIRCAMNVHNELGRGWDLYSPGDFKSPGEYKSPTKQNFSLLDNIPHMRQPLLMWRNA